MQKATKKHARTCKKLPVASFCASETAETGRIANGREQGDHVSRRQRRRKSTRSVPSRQGHRREAAKEFNWACAKLLFCVLIRGLQNLESPFGKVLILLVGRCYLGVLIRGSQNLGAPCEGVRLVTFCIVQKVTKKHTGLRPATSIQSSDGNNLREASDGTRRTRFFARNGGEKALNRCDAPVLQRKELERTSKEQPYSLRTVGYGWVRICGV